MINASPYFLTSASISENISTPCFLFILSPGIYLLRSLCASSIRVICSICFRSLPYLNFIASERFDRINPITNDFSEALLMLSNSNTTFLSSNSTKSKERGVSNIWPFAPTKSPFNLAFMEPTYSPFSRSSNPCSSTIRSTILSKSLSVGNAYIPSANGSSYSRFIFVAISHPFSS